MDFDKEAGFDMPTEIRWQKAIYELCKKHLPNVDGSGCDSGDALDVTLSEIGQVIAHYLDNDCPYCEGKGTEPSITPDQLACGPEIPCHVCKGTGDRQHLTEPPAEQGKQEHPWTKAELNSFNDGFRAGAKWMRERVEKWLREWGRSGCADIIATFPLEPEEK